MEEERSMKTKIHRNNLKHKGNSQFKHKALLLNTISRKQIKYEKYKYEIQIQIGNIRKLSCFVISYLVLSSPALSLVLLRFNHVSVWQHPVSVQQQHFVHFRAFSVSSFRYNCRIKFDIRQKEKKNLEYISTAKSEKTAANRHLSSIIYNCWIIKDFPAFLKFQVKVFLLILRITLPCLIVGTCTWGGGIKFNIWTNFTTHFALYSFTFIDLKKPSPNY